MDEFYFYINDFDVLSITETDGLKFTIEDLDGPNAGRTMDATMVRDLIANKIRWDFTIMPIERPALRQLTNILLNEYVEVRTNIDPRYDGEMSGQFYSNNRPGTVCEVADGRVLYKSVTFPLIEV